VVPNRRTRLANRLNSAAIHLLRRVAQVDAGTGLTAARLSALSVLAYGGPQTMGELARRERVSQPTVSRLVDALVRDRLVTRDPDDTDRRIVRIAVSPKGRAHMERGRARRIDALAGELAVLSDGELDALAGAVTVLERLERLAEGTRPGPPARATPRTRSTGGRR
jgi:DNA-binding MarR family transcriptional regulator